MFGAITVQKEAGAWEGTNNNNAVKKTKYAAVAEAGNNAWKETCSVMERIAGSVGSGNIVHCVEAAGEDDMYVDRKSDVITENNGLKDIDATIKTWDNIKDRVDSTLEASKDITGVDSGSFKPCHSGFEATLDGTDEVDSRKVASKHDISLDAKYIEPNVQMKVVNVDYDTNALKNIEAALGSLHDAAFKIKARADTMLENGKDFPGMIMDAKETGDSGFGASTDDLDDTVGRNLEAPKEDVLGTGPDNTKFVIKGGLSGIADSISDAKANSKSASEKLESNNDSTWNKTKTFTVDAANSTADAIETGYDAVVDGAGTAWDSTVNFLENAWGGTKRKSSDFYGTSMEAIQDGVDLTKNKTSSAWENTTNFVADIGKDNANKSDEDRWDTFATVGPVRSLAQRNQDSETAATGDMLRDMGI